MKTTLFLQRHNSASFLLKQQNGISTADLEAKRRALFQWPNFTGIRITKAERNRWEELTIDFLPVMVKGEDSGEDIVGESRHGVRRGLQHQAHKLCHIPNEETVRGSPYVLFGKMDFDLSGSPPHHSHRLKRQYKHKWVEEEKPNGTPFATGEEEEEEIVYHDSTDLNNTKKSADFYMMVRVP